MRAIKQISEKYMLSTLEYCLIFSLKIRNDGIGTPASPEIKILKTFAV